MSSSIITLNVNGLNTLNKRHRIDNFINNKEVKTIKYGIQLRTDQRLQELLLASEKAQSVQPGQAHPKQECRTEGRQGPLATEVALMTE